MEQEKKDLIPKAQRTASLITSLNTGNYASVVSALVTAIDKVVAESVPVKQLINEGAREPHVVATLAALVTKFAAMLTVGGNLKPGHEIEIAKMLIEEYPTMSLDDFNLMLSRGVRGRYGEIFRFDVAVIFGWAGQYMEEWAEEKERQLAKLKSPPVEIERPESNAIPRPDIDQAINEFLDKLRDSKVKSMPVLSRDEIRKEGQSEPPKPKAVSRPSTPQEYVEKWQRKQEWIKLFTESDGGDGWKVKDGSPTFEEWNKTLTK